MRYKEKMYIIKYACFHIILAALIMPVYRRFVFYYIKPCMGDFLPHLLWIFVIAGVIAGILVTCGRDRSYLYLVINCSLPYAAYTLLGYVFYHKRAAAVFILILLCLGAMAGYLVITVWRRAANRKVRWSNFLKVKDMYYSIGCILLMLMIGTLAGGITGIVSMELQRRAADSIDLSQYTLDQCDEKLTMLDEDKWETLNQTQRREALTVVANIEANALGLPHGLNVEPTVLDSCVSASYSDEEHLIKMNKDYIMIYSARTSVEVILHEVYHACEYRLKDVYEKAEENGLEGLPQMEELAVYKRELEHYCSLVEDDEKYRAQRVEIDANAYAEEAVSKYLCYINSGE